MSTIYSLKTRLAAARAVLDAKRYDDQRRALDHWDIFQPAPLTPMRADEGEVFYVERLYEALRCEVITWYLSYLEARLEALESPNGGRLGYEKP